MFSHLFDVLGIVVCGSRESNVGCTFGSHTSVRFAVFLLTRWLRLCYKPPIFVHFAPSSEHTRSQMLGALVYSSIDLVRTGHIRIACILGIQE